MPKKQRPDGTPLGGCVPSGPRKYWGGNPVRSQFGDAYGQASKLAPISRSRPGRSFGDPLPYVPSPSQFSGRISHQTPLPAVGAAFDVNVGEGMSSATQNAWLRNW